jgi:putative colanic acid biosynthesis acetyltransferase WcaF
MKLQTFTTAHFQRGAPRWKEALWVLVRCLIFQTPIPFPSWLKCRLLRSFGARIGENVIIRTGVWVTFPWRLTVGNNVWLGDGVWILSLAPVTIESDVCISQRSYLCSGTHDYRKESFDLITKPIVVRESSWVAAAAFVGPGVEIGPGSVVSAGSVVTTRVGPGEVVRGNPAQFVKFVGS